MTSTKKRLTMEFIWILYIATGQNWWVLIWNPICTYVTLYSKVTTGKAPSTPHQQTLNTSGCRYTREMRDIVGRAWANTRYKTQSSCMHMTVIWSGCGWDFRPQNMTHQKYKHMHNTGTVSWAIAQWSSPAGTSHGMYCSLHQDGMDRWSTFAVFFNMR